jgi:hypothetical protein
LRLVNIERPVSDQTKILLQIFFLSIQQYFVMSMLFAVVVVDFRAFKILKALFLFL